MGAKKKARKNATRRGATESWPITIFLTKDSVSSWRDALTEKKRTSPPPNEVDVAVGTLVVKDPPERVPWWAQRLSSRFKLVRNLRQRSPGAVLFVESKGRLFACTFGYGRSLLAPARLVQDFGIRVVLNTVDPAKLRSIDLRTLDSAPLLSRKQVGDGRPLASFGVDTYRDLLRGVAGARQGRRIVAGSDAVHLRLDIRNLSQLPAECAKLMRSFSAKDYRQNFAFIDHVRLVRDPAVKATLEGNLFTASRSGKLAEVGFMAGDVVESHRLDTLRASWDQAADHPVALAEIRNRLRERAKKPTAAKFITALKTDRLGEPSLETGALVRNWSLFDCLLWTTEFGNERYVLTGGDWFELDSDFVSEVERSFDSIVKRPAPLTMPDAEKLKIPKNSYFEQEYNKVAASKTGLTNLDRTDMMKFVEATGVEPCDLLDSKKGVFVHVKDGRKSSLLSHLFNQGAVSLEGLLSVAEARLTVRALAGLSKRAKSPLQDPITPGHLSVVLAIIDGKPKSGQPWRLPFFSMLTAKYAVERIERLQAKAFILRIDDRRP